MDAPLVRSSNRLEAYSDALFSIVATVMVSFVRLGDNLILWPVWKNSLWRPTNEQRVCLTGFRFLICRFFPFHTRTFQNMRWGLFAVIAPWIFFFFFFFQRNDIEMSLCIFFPGTVVKLTTAVTAKDFCLHLHISYDLQLLDGPRMVCTWVASSMHSTALASKPIDFRTLRLHSMTWGHWMSVLRPRFCAIFAFQTF